jgi:hypothetical protein
MTNLLSCGVVLAALALGSSFAAAQNAPWCFSEMGRNSSGAVTCSFQTFEQCLATLRGIGGSCSPNPFLSYSAPYPRGLSAEKRKRRR